MAPPKPHAWEWIYTFMYIYTYMGLYEHEFKICKDSSQFDNMGGGGSGGSRKRDVQKENKIVCTKTPNIYLVIAFIH